MNENKAVRNRLLAEKIIKGLESRNMEGFYAETREEALKKALELIPEGSSVGWGGSKSVEEIGLKAAVCSGNYQVYNRDVCKTEDEKRKTELAILGSDVFLCGTIHTFPVQVLIPHAEIRRDYNFSLHMETLHP